MIRSEDIIFINLVNDLVSTATENLFKEKKN